MNIKDVPNCMCFKIYFFESVKNTDTQLYLFGDKMQQIYKNYDGSFLKIGKFILFDYTSKSLGINYRFNSKNC